jgi:c-di-GMP-binding flagellar brake protein YcgR
MSSERRKHPRISKTIPVVIFGDLYNGEGHTLNLSKTGCEIAVEGGAPPRGRQLHLLLEAPMINRPIKIQLAIVRWSHRNRFGVEFIRISSTCQEDLDQYLYLIDLCPPQSATEGSPPP